jgi:hypothetical protein
MIQRLGSAILAIATTIVLLACAVRATTMDAQWVSPDLAGKKGVRSVLVMAAVRDSTNRRLFEDRMVTALSATGIKALPSYQYIPEEGAINEQRLRRVVAEAKVSHAMVTRISNVSTQVNVSPGMVMGPAWGPGWGPGPRGPGWGGGWGGANGFYNSMWMTTTIPPQITTTENVHADTRLFETSDAVVLWSAATTTSLGYNSVTQIMDQFVQLIVTTMTKDGVI